MVFDFFQKASDDFGSFLEQKAKDDALALAKFTAGLEKSRDQFGKDLKAIFGGAAGANLDDTVDALEDALLSADIGAATTTTILEDVRAVAEARGEYAEADVTAILRGGWRDAHQSRRRRAEGAGPTVILVIGANGMGKTTTIGKLAMRLRVEGGQRVLLAACDTFRAAAVGQLDEWAKRAAVDIVVPDAGVESPSAACYKALDVALGVAEVDESFRHSDLADDDGDAPAGPYDVLIVDTSGRLSNNAALNEELKKIRRTIDKRAPGAPHDTLLVVDAAVGRNAVDMARAWQADVGVSGLAVTKLDGTARAGFVVSVVEDLGIPVKLVGVGEALDDLRDFDVDAFLDSLLDVDARSVDDLKQRFAALSSERARAAPPPPTIAADAARAARRGGAAKAKSKKKKKAKNR
ncbi:7S RNA binding protein [Aureococcus anophagefferens]|nr:7S RNA binding protein [Aureococcus anophagefferens]